MSDAISSAVTGALYQEMRLNVLSNNLSNINTMGFKKDEMIFRLDNGTEPEGENSLQAISSDESEYFAGTIQVHTFIDFSQGEIMSTGNHFDLALNGKGFFCIETADGEQYTRKGNFTLNQERQLCTQEGFPVMGNSGKIVIEDQNIHIDEMGHIYVEGNSVDSLKIMDFPESSLIKKGDGVFSRIDERITGKPAEGVKVLQSYIERSNVDAITMMTEMIDTLRGFESYQKIIQFLNETTLKAINDVGQVA